MSRMFTLAKSVAVVGACVSMVAFSGISGKAVAAGFQSEPSANPGNGALELKECPADDSDTDGAVPMTVDSGQKVGVYHLVWNDEFCGNSLNSQKWHPSNEPENGGMKYVNKQGPSSDPDSNIYVENGALSLRAKMTGDWKNTKYPRTHSGMVTTKDLAAWKYGRFEIRVRTPGQVGTWPAFWLMPQQGAHGWPRDGEIDWFENLGNKGVSNRNWTSVHSSTLASESRRSQADHAVDAGSTFDSSQVALYDGYHRFAMEWEPGVMRFYHDDKLYSTVTGDQWTNSWVQNNGVVFDGGHEAPFDKKFYLIANLATNGWAGNFDQTTNLADHPFQIDYVRVYQTEEQQKQQNLSYLRYFMNGYGEQIPEKSDLPVGTKVSDLPKPHDIHAEFKGWYYDRDLHRPVGDSVTVNDDTTLFASWQPIDHRVDAEHPLGKAFTDVWPDSAFAGEIQTLRDEGITRGWSDGSFRPDANISREAMAAFLYRLAGSPAYTAPEKSPFSDVDPSREFYKEISWLASTKITTGYAEDNTFRPDASVNRDAMAAFLYRFCGAYSSKCASIVTPDKYPEIQRPKIFEDVVYKDPWGRKTTQFYNEIAWASRAGITTGWPDNTFRPTEPIARNAMAAFIYRVRHNE